MLFKINNFFSHFRKMKKSLWKKIRKEKRKKINTLEYTESNAQESLLSNPVVESCGQALVPYSLEDTPYPIETVFQVIYINLVYLNIIYLHHQTDKIDFCLQAMQKNPILAHAFQLSYNEFRAKFYNLLVISSDQGENFSLALSRQAEFFSTLTHFLELLPPPFSALGGVLRLGINEINKKNKTYESKKTLQYCITDENFTKIVSLLFSCILVKNLTGEEDLDLSVKKNFSIFWEILKKQGTHCVDKPSLSEDIEKIWAYCFCLFESTAFCNSTLSTSVENLESRQQNTIKNTNQLCGTKFFDTKKFPSKSMQLSTLNNVSKFWEENTSHGKDILSLSEMSPRTLSGLIMNI